LWDSGYTQFSVALKNAVDKIKRTPEFEKLVSETRGREALWMEHVNTIGLYLTTSKMMFNSISQTEEYYRLSKELMSMQNAIVNLDWRVVQQDKMKVVLGKYLDEAIGILSQIAKLFSAGGDPNVIDSAKPKVTTGTASPASTKTGNKIEFCFVATDDKSVSRVTGNLFHIASGDWVVGASNGRLVAGNEKVGTWCLDVIVPTGRADGKYEMRALAYDGIQTQSELTVVGEVEITGGDGVGILPSQNSIVETENQKVEVKPVSDIEAQKVPTQEESKTQKPINNDEETKVEIASNSVVQELVSVDSRILGSDPTPLAKFNIVRVLIVTDSPSSSFWSAGVYIIPNYIEFC
jgi:hypothetical protein